MRTALKWYLITGGALLVILVFLSFITPAISEASLLRGVAWTWYGRLFSAGSFVAAAVGFAIIPNYVSKREVKRIIKKIISIKGETFKAEILTPDMEKEELKNLRKRMTPMPVVKKIATERTRDPAGKGLFGVGTTIWFCPKCGMFNTPSHKFCWECGQALLFDNSIKGDRGEEAE